MARYQENIDREWDLEPLPRELKNAIQLQSIDSQKSIEIFEELSQQGSTLSLVYIGDSYANGRGIEQDVEKGLDYYNRAAQLGSVEATYRLAYWYWCQDRNMETVTILEKLSALGYSPAMYHLGLIYTSGKYVDKNESKGLHYLNNAERHGHILAKRIISIRLRTGNCGIVARLKGLIKLFELIPGYVYLSFKKPDSDRLREW